MFLWFALIGLNAQRSLFIQNISTISFIYSKSVNMNPVSIKFFVFIFSPHVIT